jgi:hypothetical protein
MERKTKLYSLMMMKISIRVKMRSITLRIIRKKLKRKRKARKYLQNIFLVMRVLMVKMILLVINQMVMMNKMLVKLEEMMVLVMSRAKHLEMISKMQKLVKLVCILEKKE